MEFNTSKEAQSAIEELQGSELDGKALFLDVSGQKKQDSQKKRFDYTKGDSKSGSM